MPIQTPIQTCVQIQMKKTDIGTYTDTNEKELTNSLAFLLIHLLHLLLFSLLQDFPLPLLHQHRLKLLTFITRCFGLKALGNRLSIKDSRWFSLLQDFSPLLHHHWKDHLMYHLKFHLKLPIFGSLLTWIHHHWQCMSFTFPTSPFVKMIKSIKKSLSFITCPRMLLSHQSAMILKKRNRNVFWFKVEGTSMCGYPEQSDGHLPR